MTSSSSPTLHSSTPYSSWSAYSLPSPEAASTPPIEWTDSSSEDQGYNAFWEAVNPTPVATYSFATRSWERSKQTLPNLKGADEIHAWLINPENQEALKNITSLYFTSTAFLPPEAIPLLSNLQTLSFTGCNFIDATLELSYLPSLQTIFLDGCHSLHTLRLAHLPQLTHMSCFNAPLRELTVTDLPCLRQIISYPCPSLEILTLCNLPVLEEMPYNPRNTACLQRYPSEYYDGYGYPDDDAFRFLGPPPKQPIPLITLNCSELPQLQQLTLMNLPKLQRLFSQPIRRSDSNQFFLLCDLPNLESIVWNASGFKPMISYQFKGLPKLDKHYWP